MFVGYIAVVGSAIAVVTVWVIGPPVPPLAVIGAVAVVVAMVPSRNLRPSMTGVGEAPIGDFFRFRNAWIPKTF